MAYTQRAVVWIYWADVDHVRVKKSIVDGRASDGGGVSFPQENPTEITEWFRDGWKIVAAPPEGTGPLTLLVLERTVGSTSGQGG